MHFSWINTVIFIFLVNVRSPVLNIQYILAFIPLKSRQGIVIVTSGRNCWCCCTLVPHSAIKRRGRAILIANFLTPCVLLIRTYIILRFYSHFAIEKRHTVDFLHSSALSAIACPTQLVHWALTFGRTWHESLISVHQFKFISCFPLLIWKNELFTSSVMIAYP